MNEWMNERREWMKSRGWEDNIRTLLQYILILGHQYILGRQHTKAPLAAALSPIMSLLYPPNPWYEWCDVSTVHSHVLPINTVEPVVKARVTNISFLLTISINIQQKKSWQLIDWRRGKCLFFFFSTTGILQGNIWRSILRKYQFDHTWLCYWSKLNSGSNFLTKVDSQFPWPSSPNSCIIRARRQKKLKISPD